MLASNDCESHCLKRSLNKLGTIIDRACLVEISIVKTPLGSQLPTSVLFNCWGKKPLSIPHNEGLLTACTADGPASS